MPSSHGSRPTVRGRCRAREPPSGQRASAGCSFFGGYAAIRCCSLVSICTTRTSSSLTWLHAASLAKPRTRTRSRSAARRCRSGSRCLGTSLPEAAPESRGSRWPPDSLATACRSGWSSTGPPVPTATCWLSVRRSKLSSAGRLRLGSERRFSIGPALTATDPTIRLDGSRIATHRHRARH